MTFLSDLPLAEHLRGRTPYGPPRHDVPVLLNSNENTHPVPEQVIRDALVELESALRSANRYPDDNAVALRDALAAYLGHGLTTDNVWAANGSNEIIQQLLQAFGGPGRSVLSFEPSYSMYPIHTANNFTRFIAVERGDGFEVTTEAAVAAITEHDPDIVFLCSPNNPTGTALSLDVVRAAYEAARGIVLVDEAYAEFLPTDEPSALTLLPGRPRLVVSRTLSKAFAFAGVRLGYLAADPGIVDAMRLVHLPYHLSSLTQAAAIVALRHSDTMLASVADIVEQRERIIVELRAMGLRPYPSGSNFVFFGGLVDARAAFEAIAQRGVLIRPTDIPGHLRVTTGTRSETDAFLTAVAEVVEQQRGAA